MKEGVAHLEDGSGDDALPIGPLAALHGVRFASACLPVAE